MTETEKQERTVRYGVTCGDGGRKETFKSHRKLLDHSNARTICVWAIRGASASLRFQRKTGFPYVKRLPRFRYPFYIEKSNSAKISHHLCVLCPDIPVQIWSNSRRKSAKLSKAVRFRIELLGIRKLQLYSIESYSISGIIFRWVRNKPWMDLGKDPYRKKTKISILGSSLAVRE